MTLKVSRMLALSLHSLGEEISLVKVLRFPATAFLTHFSMGSGLRTEEQAIY